MSIELAGHDRLLRSGDACSPGRQIHCRSERRVLRFYATIAGCGNGSWGPNVAFKCVLIVCLFGGFKFNVFVVPSPGENTVDVVRAARRRWRRIVQTPIPMLE